MARRKVTDPELLRQLNAPQQAAPAARRKVTDPAILQKLENTRAVEEAAAKKRQQILETGQNMPKAPDRIAQAFDDVALQQGQGRSFLEGLADSATFGFGDEIGAAMDLPVSSLWGGGSDPELERSRRVKGLLADQLGMPSEQYSPPSAYDVNLARRRGNLEQAWEQNPWSTGAGMLGGAVVAPGLGVVGTAARGAGLGTRLLRGAGVGATQGALYGAGSGETLPERAAGAATGTIIGAGLGAAAPVAVRGAQAVAGGVRNAVRGRPVTGLTVDQLRQQADAFYTQMEQQGVQLAGPAFQRIAQNVAVRARNAGIDPGVHPRVTGALNRLLSDASGAQGSAIPTLRHMDTLRQIIRDAADTPGERRIARIMVEGLDDNLNRLQPRDVAAGNRQAGLTALREGRQLWQRMRKGELIDNLFENARDKTGANYTQAGMHTAVRQELRGLAKRIREGKEKGWTNAERLAIQKVVRGGPVENVLRLFGKAAPRGVISASPSLAAGMYFDPVTGAIVAGGGEISKRVATAMGMRNAEAVSNMVRAGGPVAQPPALDALRYLDKPLTKAGAQQGTGAAKKPLKIYLNAGERDEYLRR